MCTNLGKGSGISATGGRLRNGETAFASFSPTALHPEGEAIIAKTADGGYRYMGRVPPFDDVRVDTDSSAYKQALRDFNVTARFYPDGHVEVTKGGLYDRKKSYKDSNAFSKDVTKRIDARSNFDREERKNLEQGRISQIEAEYYRGIIKRNSSSMAVKKMNEAIKSGMHDVKARLEVAEKAKRRAAQVIENSKRIIESKRK